MKLGPNFKSMLQDERGRISHKRVIALMLSFALMTTLIISAFTKIELDKELISAIEFIVISVVGATTVDKFTNPVTHATPDTPESDNNGN